jgi:hypothetical protein
MDQPNWYYSYINNAGCSLAANQPDTVIGIPLIRRMNERQIANPMYCTPKEHAKQELALLLITSRISVPRFSSPKEVQYVATVFCC